MIGARLPNSREAPDSLKGGEIFFTLAPTSVRKRKRAYV